MAYPEKPAPTDLPLTEDIKRRWSPVAFSDKKLDQKMIDSVFEAARWAPSCYGDQPWRYVYATKDDGEKRAALEGLLAEGNAWAKNAYLLIVSFAKTTFAHNGKPNGYHMHDTGCASGYLVLQATHMNLIGHQMAGFAADKANAVLGVPADFAPGSMIAIGYPGDPKSMDEGSQKRDASPRSRKPLCDIAMRGGWKA